MTSSRRIALYLWPKFEGEDTGDGGVRRVVEGQLRHLPQQGIDLVDDPGDADVLALHIEAPEELFRRHQTKAVVAHCHGLYWADHEWPEWAMRANEGVLRLIRYADITTAPSEWVAQTIRRHVLRDVRAVYHGIDTEEWKPLPAMEQKPYVLWNKTRPDPICDPGPVMALADRMRDWQFITTFGSDRENVLRTGRLPYEDAKRLVRAARVYLATARETFGVGTLEAMAAGVPVVGWRWGGQPEIVRHGIDGWLAEPGDIAGLDEGVRWADANRETLSIAARARAAEFTWTSAARAYASIYREAFARREALDDGPRVSIIVPAFNLDAYLPDALDSVLAQGDTDWECIVVDDASPDRCGQIAEEYAARDPRIRVIHNAENEYLARSRNLGIEAARGRFILPLDADDRLTPHAVEYLSEALDADRELDIVYGGVYFTEEDGRTPVVYGPQWEPGHSGWPMAMEPQRLLKGQNLLPYSSMYRREVWEQTGGYRARLRTAEDADFWARAVSYGYRARLLGTDTLVYRNREGSMSRENEDRRFDYLRWYPWAARDDLAPAGLAGPESVWLWRPRVSVVIPVGPGHELLVQDAVDSVVAQSYPGWECIVVNDSGAPLHLPPFVRVLTCDARDPGIARNLGVASARARYYLALDADDYLLPDCLQWLLTAASETEADVVYPDFYENPRGQYEPYALPDFDCSNLVVTGAQHSNLALTPVAVWEALGGYRQGLGWEDWDFQIRTAEAGFCTARLAAPLFVYRKETGTRREFGDKDGPEFARRRAEMERLFPRYFLEGHELACNCGKRSHTITPGVAASAMDSGPQPNSGPRLSGATEAIRVVYDGSQQGTIRYRGNSGTIYPFSAAEPVRYVLAEDVAMFEGRSGFRVERQPVTVPV